MKANYSKPQKDSATKKPAVKVTKTETLQTEPPLSEKDDVKKAEERMQKNIRR